MRERSKMTTRRRGPKLPLPSLHHRNYEANVEVSESPYYTSDNTEDIYGTTISLSQRCYVDPWDLENYDYVRKKLSDTPICCSPESYYNTSVTASPYYLLRSPPSELPLVSTQRLATTMPRNRRRSQWTNQCQLDCCLGISPSPTLRRGHYEDSRSELYGVACDKYDNTMSNKRIGFEADEDAYIDCGCTSSSASTEFHSSVDEEDIKAPTMSTNASSGYETTIERHTFSSYHKHVPQMKFPAPLPLPPFTPAYEYSNPYATLPYCSTSDCYDCSMICDRSPSRYHAMSSNDERDYNMDAFYGSDRRQRTSPSLYSGIYGNKFGLSKKGLLEIDYSCSWNYLDRIISRQY